MKTVSSASATVRSSDGTTIAFDRVGDGLPLILVGAAIQYRGLDSSSTELAELLSSHFTVLRYDRRGRGESGDTLPYAVERELDDLDAVIGEVGGPAFLLGGSSGAVLALRAAIQGLPIAGLALYEPPFIVDDSRPPLPDDYVPRLDRLVAAGRRGEALELFLTAAVGLPTEMVAGMRSSPMWQGMESVAHTLSYDGRIMGDTMRGDPSALRCFASVATRTLVMDGGDSPLFLRNAARALVDVMPNAQLRTLPGQTHAVAPSVLASALDGFFDRT